MKFRVISQLMLGLILLTIQPDSSAQTIKRKVRGVKGEISGNSANKFWRSGDIDRAAMALDSMLLRSPNDPILNFNRGIAADVSVDLKTSLSFYRKAFDLDPNSPFALWKLGESLIMRASSPIIHLPTSSDKALAR